MDMERLKFFAGAGCRHLAAALFAAAGLSVAATSVYAAATAPYVTVQARQVAQSLRAYARIEPIATVALRAVDPGTLSGLRIVPGSPVQAGQVLARMTGPRMQALLTADAQRLRSMQAREQAASHTLDIVRRQFSAQLATRQALEAARSDLAAARAAERTAAARLQAARALRTVRAPVAGTILSVQAADGEQIASGQTIATVQPAGSLWLRAEYFGADASGLRVGMTGRFQPSDAEPSVAVRVVAISPALAPDGGLRVGLVPVHAQLPGWWANGRWGSLTLEGTVRSMVLVPTQALILDHGHWWVLLRTASGDTPRRVVPGPSRGWRTAIASGLSAGQQVVVTDAFLQYHRGIASHYTPPD